MQRQPAAVKSFVDIRPQIFINRCIIINELSLNTTSRALGGAIYRYFSGDVDIIMQLFGRF